MILAECNTVHLVWVLGHKRIQSNEIADQLALHPLIRHEPTCCISWTVTGQAIRDWTVREHQKDQQSTPAQKQAKCFLNKPSTKRPIKLLKFSRIKIRPMTQLLTEHRYLRRHLQIREIK